jgi:RHS repeat-associated protein
LLLSLVCVGVGLFLWQKEAIADFPATMAGGYCLMNHAGVCQWAPPNSATLEEACQTVENVDPYGRDWSWNGAPHPAARCGFDGQPVFDYQAFGPKSCPANSSVVGVTNSCACNAGFTQSGSDADTTCVAEAPPKSAGGCPSGGQGAGGDPNKPCPEPTGNPINPLTGNKYQVETDYAGAGTYPLRFERYYNSNTGFGSGRLGARWRHTFDRSISVSGANATVTRPDGKRFVFTQSGADWVAPADVMDKLVQTGGGWTYTAAPNDEAETYDAAGRLVSIANRAGVAHNLAYDGSGRLATVTHSVSGGTLAFAYDVANRIVSMTDPAGKVFKYAYPTGNLSSVTFPDDTASTTDNPVRTYVYNESANTSGASFPAHLTGIVDENASRFTTYKYATDGRAISTERSGPVAAYSVAYNVDGTSTVTDPLSTARILGAQTIQGMPRHTGADQPCDGCGLASSISYDANGFLTGATNFNGVASTYVHDAGGLETSRTEASGTPQQRTVSTQWDTTFRLPTGIAEPLRITTNSYDPDGNQCGARGALCSKSIQATTDTNGSQGFGATPTGTARTWIYTYNANGSVLTMDGPRSDVSDVTTYTYYPNNDADAGRRGNIETITNAAGHVTSFAAYNVHGQPTSIVDPNGLTTTLAYDLRQRLTSRTVGGEITSYEYDGVGSLTKVTLPDGSFLSYAYDAAHRMTGMEDNLGNRIAYTLDAMGNRTLEEVRDPGNNLAQTRSRVFNNLNRLFQEIGAATQTTQYAYDNQGNLTSIDGPLAGTGDVTSNAYDALNRLRQVTNPGSVVTQYAYNGLDALTSVTDPRSLVTGYTVDGLGNLNQQASPDTGNTSNSYDPAGNLLTHTDAKGQVTTYAYDALNRVTSITFQDGSKQTYGYDSGTNALGRLTSISETDPGLQVTGLLAYGYDSHGRVTVETRTIAGIPYATAYRYDSSGRRDQIAYPSGRTVDFTFDTAGRVNSVNTTPSGGSAQAIASSITYHPFGGVTGFTFGNSQTYTRMVDPDGRISSYSLGSQSFGISFDLASRITGIAETGNPPNTNTYGYDALDRLTSAILPSTNYGYSYDGVGNRLTKVVGAGTDTYTYSSTSNRIATLTPSSGPVRSFTLDANGSTTADGLNTYTYDVRGRMVQAVSSLGTTTYQVNALGQRVRKTNTLGDRVFHYDIQGHLIAETTAAGATLKEYVWLGDMPLAVLDGTDRYYIHTDHLNTPRLIADSTGTTVWRHDNTEPFGDSPADENPSGLGSFPFPLRFMGQYQDIETNLRDNWFRTFDPARGGYLQSDPIGLRGGLNTYVYVDSDPLGSTDEKGLAKGKFIYTGCSEGQEARCIEKCRAEGVGVKDCNQVWVQIPGVNGGKPKFKDWFCVCEEKSSPPICGPDCIKTIAFVGAIVVMICTRIPIPVP